MFNFVLIASLALPMRSPIDQDGDGFNDVTGERIPQTEQQEEDLTNEEVREIIDQIINPVDPAPLPGGVIAPPTQD